MNIAKTDFPEKIVSEKIILRVLNIEDADAIFDIYSHEDSAKYDDWVPMKQHDEARSLIVNSIKSFQNKEEIRYGIIEAETNKMVGSCGIFSFDQWNKKCMIYYQIHHDHRSKGFATEAVKLLIGFAFETLNANRIEAYVTPGNDPSVKVLENNGFQNEGLLRQMEFYKDKFWDGIVMGLLKEDYESK